MKVSQLIELLQECSPDAEVLFWDGDERRFIDINLLNKREVVA